MGNNHQKKDYTKGEVIVIKITQLWLQKMNSNVTMSSFYCLVSKIWEKNSILCYYKTGKMPGLCCFLSAKNYPKIFMQVCN